MLVPRPRVSLTFAVMQPSGAPLPASAWRRAGSILCGTQPASRDRMLMCDAPVEVPLRLATSAQHLLNAKPSLLSVPARAACQHSAC